MSLFNAVNSILKFPVQTSKGSSSAHMLIKQMPIELLALSSFRPGRSLLTPAIGLKYALPFGE